MSYPLMRPFLHALPPETAHRLAVWALAHGLVPPQPVIEDPALRVRLAGLDLANPVGLAAGFDKNACTPGHIFEQGFGFVECGTVTPKPQRGNPKPRLFRLPEQGAIINRLGFNNKGLEVFVENLSKSRGKPRSGPVGANIGKNRDSGDAVADYVAGLKAVYPYADYVSVNISSPNTPGLRELQQDTALRALMEPLLAARDAQPVRKPVFVKLAPDLSAADCEALASLALALKLDGLIIGNTTTARPKGTDTGEAGGLSGRPLMQPSTNVLREMYRLTQGKITLIGVGGIASPADAYAKIRAGASAVQLYTALVYQGFGLISEIRRGLLDDLKRDGFATIGEAVGVDA